MSVGELEEIPEKQQNLVTSSLTGATSKVGNDAGREYSEGEGARRFKKA